MSVIIVKAKFKNPAPAVYENPELVIDRAEVARLVALAERPITVQNVMPKNCRINGYPITWGME